MSTKPTDAEQIESILGSVVDEYLDQRAEGNQPDIEAFAERHPDLADLIRGSLRALDVVGDRLDSGGGDVGESPVKERKQLGDFAILRELGSGGMGFVYEAEQLSMGRHVALKILPMAGALQEKSLQRFRNEVRAASMLDHPNIVSIYSVGEDRGVHYYAMQLIRGQSLAKVIEALSATDDPTRSLTGDSISQIVSAAARTPSNAIEDPKEDDVAKQPGSEVRPSADTKAEFQAYASTLKNASGNAEYFRAVARLGIQAAEALGHAHDLGVLHRDIKPGNLMLDASTNLYITDFGLARIEADAGMTTTGDLVGTLRYMSPEQALAKRGVIDHRCDIYSLGMTLYELIALRPAFGTLNRQELLNQIAFEEPVKLRKRDRSLPQELETIVHKAMEKEPQERYATAMELAVDLQAFLDDRPILAKPPGAVELARKWSRRHRALVLTASVSVLLLLFIAVLMLSVSNAMIAKERNAKSAALKDRTAALAEKGTALIEKAHALTVAETNLQKALDAVDSMLTQVSEQTSSIPELTSLRRDLLNKAVALSKDLLAENPDDEGVRFQLAKTLYLLGQVYYNLGELDAAEQQRRDAALILESMTAEFPNEGDYAFYLARTYHQLTYHSVNRDESRELFIKAVALLEKIVTQNPDQPKYKDQLLASYCGHAIIVGALFNDRPAALEIVQRGIDLGSSNDAVSRGRLAGAFSTKAKQLQSLGRHAEAEQSLLSALNCLRQQLRLTSDTMPKGILHFRRTLSQTLEEYAVLLRKLDRHEEAIEKYKESIAVTADIQREFPSQPWGGEKLAERRSVLLQLVLEQGHLKEATQLFDELEMPSNLLSATGTRDIAFAYDQMGRSADAAETYENAFEQWMVEDPADPQLHRTLIHLGYGGEGFRERKLLAHRFAEEAVRRMPNNPLCSHTLGVSYYRLDRFEESIECLERALELDSSRKNWRLDLALSQASMHLQAAEYREAVTQLSIAIDIVPFSHLFKRRGLAHFYVAEFDSALSDLKKAIELVPTDVSSLTWIPPELVAACPDEQFCNGMVELADKLLELNKRDPFRTRLARAKFFDGLAVHGKAAEEYEAAIKLNPDDPSVLNAFAQMLATALDSDFQDPERAVKLARKATELSPKNKPYWNTLGLALYRDGKWEAAVEALETSTELEGGYGYDCVLLSMAHAQLGNTDMARERYEKAVTFFEKQDLDDETLMSLRSEAEQLIQDL